MMNDEKAETGKLDHRIPAFPSRCAQPTPISHVEQFVMLAKALKYAKNEAERYSHVP